MPIQQILPDGRVRIKNSTTGETKDVAPVELGKYNPALIDQYQSMVKTPTPQTQQTPQVQQQPATQQNAPMIPQQPQEPSMITKVGNAGISALKAVFSAPTRFGKGIGNAIDATTQSANQDVITKNAMANSDALRNAAIRASQSGDKAKATKLFEMSRKALGPIQKVALGTEKNLATGQEDLTKGAVGTGSFFIPGGNTPLGRIGSNMVAGGMQGYGNSSTGNEVADTMGGAAIAGAISGTGEAIGAGFNLAKKGIGKIKDIASNKAVQGYGKATPTMYANAVEDHGIDINNLVKKYVPAGADYNTMLGDVSKRGNGGVLGFKMGQAENTIQKAVDAAGATVRVSGDDVIKELTAQRRLMKQTVGNERNVAALDEIIKETKKLFKNGMSTKQLLTLKRAADSKFGAAVVDESTGSVAAQAQKVLANFARNKLKVMLPTVADALETETELYTLKPLLNRARGTLNTQGSQIRKGSFQGVTDIVNPFAYTDAAMNTPQISSRMFGNKTGIGATPAAAKTSQNIVPKVLSSTAVGLLNNRDNQTYNKQDTVDQTDSQNHDTSITDQGLGATPPKYLNPYNQPPEALYREYQNALNFGDNKTAAKLRQMYEDETAYQKNNKTAEPKKTEKQQMFANSAVAAKQALNLLNTNNVSTGLGQKQLGKIGEVFGTNSSDQQKYRSSLAIARTTVRSALLGSQMSPGEMESIAAFIPEFDDAPSTAKSKLNTFIELMNTFGKNLEGTAPDYSGLGANPQQAMQ